MKKKLMAVACLSFASLLAFGGCGVGGGDDSSGKKEKGYLQVQADPSKFGLENFNEAYLPVTGKAGGILERSGQIDVAILFEGMEPGWEAVAKEYERLHRNRVDVVLTPNLTATTYPDQLKNEFTSIETTDWDIVQGNLAPSGATSDYCVDMYNYVFMSNGYAGGEVWSVVLEEDAYITNKSSNATNSTYILNTEGLQTAWFINDIAFNDAVAEGYSAKDDEGNSVKPRTWDELVELCQCMVTAGYSNPLGLSLSDDSITASQFTWLLRVYGDLYYRNEYPNIVREDKKDKFVLDLTSQNPEGDVDFQVSYPKLMNMILEGTSPLYKGAKSNKFKDFLGQFEKVWEYLHANAVGTSPAEMRNEFQNQTKGKGSPQIILDYAGTGLAFQKSEKIQLDFFDHPMMESDYIAEGTLLRDVGGNGGYLSVIQHGNDPEQTELSMDFVKFFMSPYAQSIYYDALIEHNLTPKGMTLVDNDLVCIPTEWEQFFKTDKITFTGLSDNNPFISWLIRGINNGTETKKKSAELWKKYYQGSITMEYFCNQWHSAMMVDWATHCDLYNWNENIYKNEYRDQDDTNPKN